MRLLLTVAFICLAGDVSLAQFGRDWRTPTPARRAAQAAAEIHIADEPTFIDAATLVPLGLAVPVTVDFQDKPLTDVVKWLQDEQKLAVFLDVRALGDAGLAIDKPISERLHNEPLHLLLDRLRKPCGLTWYAENDVARITTIEMADLHFVSLAYNVGDLIEAGCVPEDIETTLRTCSSGAWEEVDGEGGALVTLGDVAFVYNSDKVHREIAGILAGIRKHGRRTFAPDAAQHEALRQILKRKVTVNFDQKPLDAAIAELARVTQADIRLDRAVLDDEGLSAQSPVTAQLADQPLQFVLKILLEEAGRSWMLQDGILWVTSIKESEWHLKAAVYDVRDLCHNASEAHALREALWEQTSGFWMETDGEGGAIEFPRPGVMVVRQSDRGHDEVLQLLEKYRAALATSKPQQRGGVDPLEVVIRCYRLPAATASDLAPLLPTLVRPETWTSAEHPQAPGKILHAIASTPEVRDQGTVPPKQPGQGAATATSSFAVLEHTTLMIQQSREVHDDILRLIDAIERGDSRDHLQYMQMGGRMHRGMGGGFFSIQK